MFMGTQHKRSTPQESHSPAQARRRPIAQRCRPALLSRTAALPNPQTGTRPLSTHKAALCTSTCVHTLTC